MVSATGFTKTDLKIPSETYGWDLDVWCFIPSGVDKPADNVDTNGGWPVIVMAHGWSRNKLMSLSPYAETFANSGYACLVFDYRRWGASDGTSRHVLNVEEQHEDYRSVIKYAQLQPEINPDRVVVWGTSFAVIAQGPYPGVLRSLPLSATIVISIVIDAFKQLLGLSPVYILAAGGPNKPAALMFEGIVDLCTDPGRG
ncbi:hypothetical protein PQX77_015656 [Marasmius sp. AFHP31]|nr:hypothetical protein PQX77_015656 [Marasmius sp. AFHP31]